MRIGINTLFFIPGEVGGSETYLFETLTALRAQNGDDTFVLFTQRENDAWLRDRFPQGDRTSFVMLDFHAVSRAVRVLREQTALPVLAKRHALDVLWSPGYTAPFFCGVPQAVSLLDMQYRRFPEDLSLPARLVTHGLVCASARRAGCILTLSEFSKSEILRFTAARPGTITVTPLAVKASFAEARDPEGQRSLRSRLLPGDEPYLLCVAHTYPHKNIAMLVEAFALLAAKVPHRLVLIGKARRGERAVQEALQRLTDPSRVTRLKEVTAEELVALYQGAACFVFPSLYEGFGLPVLEAMAAGIPVAAAGIPTVREIGSTFPWYFDGRSPGDAAQIILNALTEAQPDRNRRCVAAQRHALGYTWAETARRTREALVVSSSDAL